MLTIIGLGNPTPAYNNTRHNAGYMLLDGIINGKYMTRATFPHGTRFRKSSILYSSLEGEVDGTSFVMVKPMTFMNESGKALASLITKGEIRDISELLVIVDDVDLEVGRLRLRRSGSAGGHNGLKSIISHLGTNEFARLRIGAGPRPGGHEMVDYVLGKFRPDEYDLLDKALDRAGETVAAWITESFDKASSIASQITTTNL